MTIREEPNARVVEFFASHTAANVRLFLTEHLARCGVDLAKYPQAVRSSWPRNDYVDPRASCALVLCEHWGADPYYYPDIHKAFERTAKALRKVCWYEDAGWESYCPGVAYFWVTPRLIA